MTSKEVINFKVLPLQFASNSTSYHTLFIKEHFARMNDDSKPLGQTLFLLNIPPYVTKENLKTLFASFGNIQEVIFDDSEDNFTKNDGFKKGFIVFKTRDALIKALNVSKLNVLSTKENSLKIGIEKWIEEYNDSIKSHEELQSEINEFMENFNENGKMHKSNITDDNDGWTVVTKAGRKAGLSRKESVQNNLDVKNIKKTKKKELKNFYTFQIRETQMKNIAELRKNYEEAKNKVKLMKAARKFKPY